MLHVPLLKVLLIVGDIDVQSIGRYDPAVVHRVLVRMSQRNTMIRLCQVGKVEAGDEFEDLHRGLQAPFQVGQQRLQLALREEHDRIRPPSR